MYLYKKDIQCFFGGNYQYFFLPTEGTGATVILDAMRFCVPFVFWLGGIIAAAICVIDVKLSGRKYKYLILWRTAVFLLCVINAAASLAYVDISYGLTDYLRMRNSSTTVYEEYYVDPMSADVTINDPKRNLIYIFIESMENTYADAQMGGHRSTTIFLILHSWLMKISRFQTPTG